MRSSPYEVVQVATGERHSLFIKEDGSLWGMGSYYWGELGTGKDRNNFSQNKTSSARQKSPFKILEEGVVQVAAGGNHSLFIKEDGSLWGMGRNDQGQLGIDNEDDQKTPVQIRTSGVVQVTAGTDHSLFIDENGTLWGMGSSSSGQLGIDNNSTPQPIANGVIQVSAGDSHTLYIDSNGSLWGMGLNEDGQLGLGHSNDQNTPVQIRNSGVLQVSAGLTILYLSMKMNRSGQWVGITKGNWEQVTVQTTTRLFVFLSTVCGLKIIWKAPVLEYRCMPQIISWAG